MTTATDPHRPADHFRVDPLPRVQPWWRRRLELLVTGGTILLAILVILIALSSRGKVIDFQLPDPQSVAPDGPASAWLDPRYASGVSPVWQTDLQVFGVSANRELVIAQTWDSDDVPGLAGLDLYTGEPRWQLDALDCHSRGLLNGEAFCVDRTIGEVAKVFPIAEKVVRVNLNEGSISPLMVWDRRIHWLALVGVDDLGPILQLVGHQGGQLVALGSDGEPRWTTEYSSSGFCELIGEQIVCQDPTASDLQIFNPANGVLVRDVPWLNLSVLATDGYIHIVDGEQRARSYEGEPIDGIDPAGRYDYPSYPDRIHFPLAAYASNPSPLLRDANGLIRAELIDGEWVGANGPLPSGASPEAISADGAVLLLFGTDARANGNFLRLASRMGEWIADVSDAPAQLYDGIIVVDFVIHPPARP